MNRPSGLRRSFSFLVLLVLLVGCGGQVAAKVTGKLVADGQPYAVKSGETLHLSFENPNAPGGSQAFPATVKPDGTFTVPGPGGKGIPPGNYKIRVNLSSGGSDPDSLARLAELNAQFNTINGKEVEIGKEGVSNLTIDIAKGTVSK